MKKHLIALAVAGAVAAPAMAQNVSISGTIDAGYASGRINDSTDKMNGLAGNAFGTTGIAFKGSEDLGGGLKASFVINQEFSPATGARTDYTAGTTSGVDAGSFQEASVALAGGFGSIKLGHLTMSSRDAGGVGRFAGNFGRLSSTWRTNGDKVDNAVEYTTPSIQGFTVAVAMSNDGTKDAATNDPKDTGVIVKYANGAFAGALAQTTRDSGAAQDNKETVLGLQYDLGMAKIGLVRATDKDTNKESATVAQVAAPLGNGITAYGSLHNYKENGTTNKANGYSVALTKALSKRTTVYVGYASIDNKNSAEYKFSIIGKGVAGQTSSATTVGLTHNF